METKYNCYDFPGVDNVPAYSLHERNYMYGFFGGKAVHALMSRTGQSSEVFYTKATLHQPNEDKSGVYTSKVHQCKQTKSTRIAGMPE